MMRRWTLVGPGRRLGAAVLAAGLVLVAAAHLAAPAAIMPLYDGVSTQEPYRYVTPGPAQDGSPFSYEATVPAGGGLSPAIPARTDESPPQAQLVAPAGAFRIGPGVTSMAVTIEPLAPEPATGVVGNAYAIRIADQDGVIAPVVPSVGVTVILRSPHGVQDGIIARLEDGAWVPIHTEAAGPPHLYIANPDVLGTFAILGTVSAGPDPLIIALGVVLVLAALVGAALLVWRRRRRPPPASSRPPRSSTRR
jgi:hypothetical protein